MLARRKEIVGWAFAAMSLASMAGVGQAAIITSISNIAPTDDIIAQQASGAAARSWTFKTDASYHDIGQTFNLAEAATLDRITLRINSTPSNATGKPFTLTLSTVNSQTPVTTISAQSGILPALLGAGDFLTFDIADVALNASTQYVFMLHFTGDTPTVNQAIAFSIHTGGGGYGDGRSDEYSGSTYGNQNDPAWDYQFYLQSAVPEPASLALLGLGGLMLLPRRNRKVAG